MPQILLLYNSGAGQQDPQHFLNSVTAIFEEADTQVTARKVDFGKNPFEELPDVDYIVVAGGDGTVGYIVDRMLRHNIDLPLGIIPAGTANDFARMLGASSDPRLAAQQILRGEVRTVDCGRVNGRFFVNILSFGLFTTTSQHTFGLGKRIFGRVAYFFEGLGELRHIRAIPLIVRSDGEEFTAEVITALIFNGRTAGRFPLARHAQPDDGLLDGVFILRRPIWRLLFDAVRYLCGGSPSSFRLVRSRRFHLTTPLTDVITDTDGERGPHFPLDVECISGNLKIKI